MDGLMVGWMDKKMLTSLMDFFWLSKNVMNMKNIKRYEKYEKSNNILIKCMIKIVFGILGNLEDVKNEEIVIEADR